MRTLMVVFLVSVALAACGGGGEKTPAPAPAPAPAPPPADTGVGSITGKAMFEGEGPKQAGIQMGADPVCAKLHATPLTTEFVVVNADKSLRNVFVYVKEGLGARKYPVPTEPAVIDQVGCQYKPHVFGLRAAQELEVINSDATLHNIHAMPKLNKQFNIGQPVKGLKTRRKFEIPEVMIPFKCDVHKWMNAYAGVLDHPFFGVTAEAGSVQLKDVPAGTYVIEAWHEKYGTQTQSVTLGANETKEITFTFKDTGASN